VLQVDHYITAKKKSVYFDPRNGTTVCAADNAGKAWHNPIEIVIQRHVEAREGGQVVEELLACANKQKKWTITELEAQITYLNGLWR